ncbi:hypothetical protein HanRHA438_Chr11g0492051 [Helianthus annuus]|nr:hypothetical protein HanRHA438_Chr11g0492051 [Helianthus annuus]
MTPIHLCHPQLATHHITISSRPATTNIKHHRLPPTNTLTPPPPLLSSPPPTSSARGVQIVFFFKNRFRFFSKKRKPIFL